ncbi:MAG: class I tRNA ligase family protein, partial [bacterium]
LAVFREALESTVILLSPMVPHICEELWERLGQKGSISLVSWPKYDEQVLKEEEIMLVVQINGKLRGRITVGADSSDEELKETIFANPRIQELLKGKTVKRFVVVPRKLVNLVV